MDWQSIGFFGGLLSVWAGLILGTLKWSLDRQGQHMDQRHEDLKKLIDSQLGRVQKVELEMADLKVEMARDFVRRDDWIRGISVIEAKIDGLIGRMYERNQP